jgi:Core-2/I-Branching enzyme
VFAGGKKPMKILSELDELDKPNGGIRIGYIISAYQKPESLIRLVRRLDSPRDWFFIHYDLRSPDQEFNLLRQAFRDKPNIKLLPRHKCRWGDFGHVLATLKGIEEIIRLGLTCDYAIVLTGQDYPIKPNEMIRHQLKAAAGRSFMESAAWPIPNWENGRVIRRIQNYHLHLPFPRWSRSLGWPASRQNIPIPLRRKIPGGLHPYFGSSYWYLHRRCLEYIHDYVLQNPDYVRFFYRVLIPDECFFQTLLMNSSMAQDIEKRALTYVDWRAPWPGILTVHDLPRLLTSDCLFARKFDTRVDSEVLDRLDSAGKAMAA